MNQIKVLDRETIDRIAAGEVVERPASVVKELIENSVDAGADVITAEIRDGGKSLIRVTDNGFGIPKDEVRTAFLRHSTSKISTSSDLLSIHSFGFRGEALSSIAAVSKVELITRTLDSLTGIRYLINGGIEEALDEIGAPCGSTFIVRNLFYNTPARAKFLKTAASETSAVISVVEELALSHPDISFSLTADGRKKLFTAGNAKLLETAYQIYGRDITRAMAPIDVSCPLLRIHGYIGRSVISRGNRNYELFFVNGRHIRSTLISKAVEEGYRGALMQHRYPFVLLNIDTEPSLVDVNVHPQKLEVRFSEQAEVYDEIFRAVSQSVRNSERVESVSLSSDDISENAKKDEEKESRTAVPQAFEEARISFIKEHTVSPVISDKVGAEEQLDLFDSRREKEGEIRIIGQTLGTYILFEYDGSFFICDQHAAHEKVMYEKLMKAYRDKTVMPQKIIPRVIPLSPSRLEVFKDNIERFSDLGFEIEEFGRNEYRVTAVPLDIFGADVDELFNDLADELEAPSGKDPETIASAIALRSCKSAVKANDKISILEQKALISNLLELDDPYHCPHGRPTIIKFTKYELDKKFSRIV